MRPLAPFLTLCASWACVLWTFSASAEEFYMKDGSIVTAAYIGEQGGVITILDAEGSRTLDRTKVQTIRWIKVEDAELRKKAKREKKKYRKQLEKDIRKILKEYGRAKKDERPSIANQLRAYRELDRIPVFADAVISKKEPVRWLALEQLESMKSPEAVAPLVLGAVATRDTNYSDRAHKAAVEKHEEFARILYEYAAEIPMEKDARINAMNRIQAFGNEDSVPGLVSTLIRLAMEVNVSKATVQGFREKPLNLGLTSLTVQLPVVDYFHAATTLRYSTSDVRAMKAAAAASLKSITGRDFGEDAGAWQRWWLEKEKERKER